MRDDEAMREQAAGDRAELIRRAAERADRSDRAGRADRTDRTDRAERMGRMERTDRAEPVERVGPAGYAPGAADEVTLPPGDERREAHARDLDDPADANVDPDVLRDGGPTRHRGVATTTGGRRAGPASVTRRPRPPGGKVAPTTTGDAGSGKLRRS